jgi:adenylate cyclase class IV
MTEAFDSETRELELKFKADSVNLSDFTVFCKNLKPVSSLEVAGWDVYFSGPGQAFEFLRYRAGDKKEVTVKIKTNDKNNNDRIEVDLPLATKVTESLVAKFAKTLGFKENFRIYKYCSIFFYEKVDLVYYITFNEKMQETGRFIEVEARKDVVQDNAEDAWRSVREYEQHLKAFDITRANRMKRSLWEMFKKD